MHGILLRRPMVTAALIAALATIAMEFEEGSKNGHPTKSIIR